MACGEMHRALHKGVKGYIFRLLITFDQSANVIFGDGEPDETISSRWGRAVASGHPGWLPRIGCKLLDKIDPCHCASSIEFRDGAPDPHHLDEHEESI